MSEWEWESGEGGVGYNGFELASLILMHTMPMLQITTVWLLVVINLQVDWSQVREAVDKYHL